jgi:hypothetical protein
MANTKYKIASLTLATLLLGSVLGMMTAGEAFADFATMECKKNQKKLRCIIHDQDRPMEVRVYAANGDVKTTLEQTLTFDKKGFHVRQLANFEIMGVHVDSHDHIVVVYDWNYDTTEFKMEKGYTP